MYSPPSGCLSTPSWRLLTRPAPGNTSSDTRPLTDLLPQRSVLGPMLFILYTQPISCIIHQCGSNLQMFFDNTQLFSSAFPADFGTLIKQRCVSNMSRLRWIPTNSDLMMTKLRHWLSVFAPEQVSSVMSISRLVVVLIPFLPKVESLGVALDSSLTMSDHISYVCHSACLELHRVSTICLFLITSGLQLLSVLGSCLRLITSLSYWQVSLQIGWPYFKEY